MAYVAGPVIREEANLDPWVQSCYSIIQEAAIYTKQRVAIPYVENSLEQATPREFAAQILGRIRNSRSVVAVFLPNDLSTPIECALAVREGKRVLILHREGVRVPRLLAGLSGVETRAFEDFEHLHSVEQISKFLKRR